MLCCAALAPNLITRHIFAGNQTCAGDAVPLWEHDLRAASTKALGQIFGATQRIGCNCSAFGCISMQG